MKYAGAVYEARTHGSVRGMRRARLTLLDVLIEKYFTNERVGVKPWYLSFLQ